MVWRDPADIERDRQVRWRAVVVWAVFALLLGAALGAQVWVPQMSRLPLGPPVSAGSLTAQVPEDWKATTSPQPPQIAAESPPGGAAQRLEISLLRGPEHLSMLGLLESRHEEAPLLEVRTNLKVEGRPAAMITVGGLAALGPSKSAIELYISAMAIQYEPGVYVVVELQRRGSWNNADAIVVQQIADTVRLSGPEDDLE